MDSKIPITVLVQTKNEQVGIAACLESLKRFGEVIVVDSNSTDDTAAIASSYGVKVINFTWDGTYPKKKQWQLDNVETAYDWILFLDADEKPSPDLLDELERLDRTRSAYDVELTYVFEGRPLKHGHRVRKRCLLKRGYARFPEIEDIDAPGMGELEGHYQPEVVGRVGVLRERLLHDDQDPIRTWFDRHNRYSDWEAYLRRNASTKRAVAGHRSTQGRIFDRVPGKPLAFFAYAYVVRAGFLDGTPGLNYALALTYYYWQIGLKVRELRRRR